MTAQWLCIQVKEAEQARLIRSALYESQLMIQDMMVDPDYLADHDCDLDRDKRHLTWLKQQEDRAEALVIRMQAEDNP
jgi:hypothetical protein